MDVRDYDNFDLAIEAVADKAGDDSGGGSGGGAFEVRVLDSPAGEAAATFTFPFTPEGLENFTLRMAAGRSVVRRMGSSHTARAREFGGELYDAVFTGEVETCFHRSLDAADREGRGLRVRLRLGTAPELAPVPWEFLYSRSLGRFLTLSNLTPVVRYADLAQRQRPLQVEPPLRILVLAASPSDYDQLDVDAEVALLEEATADLVRTGRIELHRVAEPSLSGVQQQLRKDAFHILHFIGHGVFDERDDMGVLALEDDEGRARGVSGEELGMMLHDHASLRMVVLNACEGSRTSADNPSGGVAQSLVRQGTSAVVAMQFEISDRSAIAFSHELYLAMADGYPVDAAVAEARKAVFARASDVEWGTPVLHLRASDGRIFDIDAAPAPADVDHLLTRADEARRAPDETGTISAIGVLKRILALDPDNAQARAMLADLDDSGVAVTPPPPPPGSPSERAAADVQHEAEEVDAAATVTPVIPAAPDEPPGDTSQTTADPTPSPIRPRPAADPVADPVADPATTGADETGGPATVGADRAPDPPAGSMAPTERVVSTPAVTPPKSGMRDEPSVMMPDHPSPDAVALPRQPTTDLPPLRAHAAPTAAPPQDPSVPPQAGDGDDNHRRPAWVPWAVGAAVAVVLVGGGLQLLGGEDGADDRPTTAATAPVTPAATTAADGAPGDTSTDATATEGGDTAWLHDLDPAWLVAFPLDGPPSIDGDPDEWPLLASAEWEATTPVAGDPGSVEGFGMLGWDTSALYVFAAVRDDDVFQGWHDKPAQLWQGDSVNLEVTVEHAPDMGLALLDSDVHVLLGPDDGQSGGPLAAVNPVVVDGATGNTSFGAGGVDDRIELASRRIDEGYQLEAAIPWAVFDMDSPSRGTVLGANVNVSTVGPDGTFAGMVSTSPGRTTQADSACWSRLLLWDDPSVTPPAPGEDLVAGSASSPGFDGPVVTWGSLDDVELPPQGCG